MESCTNMNYRDVTNLKTYPMSVDGNATKTVVIDHIDKELLILKNQKIIKGKPGNDQISEYLACNILKICGYDVQDTKLVYYKGLLVVAIVLKNEITQLKQVRSYFTDESRILYDLDYIYSLTETLKSKIDIERFKEHIRKLVLVSYVFCNVDLHPGNIGFNKINGKYEPSEIYDLGGSFLSAYAEDIDKLRSVEKSLETKVRLSARDYNVLEYMTKEELQGINKKLIENKEKIKELINTLPEGFREYGEVCYQIAVKRSSVDFPSSLNWE